MSSRLSNIRSLHTYRRFILIESIWSKVDFFCEFLKTLSSSNLMKIDDSSNNKTNHPSMCLLKVVKLTCKSWRFFDIFLSQSQSFFLVFPDVNFLIQIVQIFAKFPCFETDFFRHQRDSQLFAQ